jgi:hypothetical protein
MILSPLGFFSPTFVINIPKPNRTGFKYLQEYNGSMDDKGNSHMSFVEAATNML